MPKGFPWRPRTSTPWATPCGGNLIEGNTANDNLGDGIAVGGGGHTIADNAAYNNAAFGITAAEGNIDGGGNTASGNGEPLQCVGVVCTPGAGAPPSSADLTPPDTQLLSSPLNGSSTAQPAVFTFTGSDNIAPPTALRFECRLDAPPDPAPEPPGTGRARCAASRPPWTTGTSAAAR